MREYTKRKEERNERIYEKKEERKKRNQEKH